MKVLMIGTNLNIANGVASFQMNYFRNMDPNIVKIDFLLLEECESPYVEEIKKNGGNIYVLPSIKNLKAHISYCKTIIENGNYDIIHDNILIKSFPIMMCAKRAGVPVRILHSHSSGLGDNFIKININKILIPLLRSLCNVRLACSTLAGENLFHKKFFKIVPNAINMNNFKPNSERRNIVRRRMGADKKIVVGSVGRMDYPKNPFFAIDVFEEFLKLEPDAEYWWIGDGPYLIKVQEYIESKNLQNNVVLYGNREDASDLYQAMDIFFMPSIFEGLPVVGVEAQAAELPCVISSNITKELEYSNLITYISLEESKGYWASQLEKAVHYKENNKLFIDSNKFDIEIQASRLTQIYAEELENIAKYSHK